MDTVTEVGTLSSPLLT